MTISFWMLAKSAALANGKQARMIGNGTVTTCTLGLDAADALILRQAGSGEFLGFQAALSCGSPTINAVSVDSLE